MEITEIRVRLANERTVKAYVNIVFDDCFIVKGLKIIRARKLFVAMPSNKRGESFMDVAYPITKEMRDIMEEAIFNAYEDEMDRVRDEYTPSQHL